MDANMDDWQGPRLLVVGVGGGGCNAVKRMLDDASSADIQFLALNTDQKALNTFPQRENLVTMCIGKSATKGLGAGARPEVGAAAAEESKSKISDLMQGYNMVFVTCGEGGGTGTGAAPVVAREAKELGALVVGVVTRPFGFEGQKRKQFADHGIAALQKHVDTLLIVENDRIQTALGKKIPFPQALKEADNVLAGAVMAIYAIMNDTGLINVDFADVRTVMTDAGLALMGTGETILSEDEPRAASQAAMQAISNPLLANVQIKGARSCMINITGGEDLTMEHIAEINETVQAAVGDGTEIIFGAVIDPSMEQRVRVTVVATGFDMPAQPTTPLHPARTTNPMTRPTTSIPTSLPNARPHTVPPSSMRPPATPTPSWMEEEAEPVGASASPRPGSMPIPAFLQRHTK